MELLTVRPDTSRGPVDLLLDGAHNPAGFETLLAALADLRSQLSPGRLTLVTGFMADKDVAGILDGCSASPVVEGARILATRVNVERAMPAQQLARAWRERFPGCEVVAVEPPERALAEALEAAARDGGAVVVAGSLYLVGAARASLASRGLIA